MKRDLTFTIFAGSIISVVVALYLAPSRLDYYDSFVETTISHNIEVAGTKSVKYIDFHATQDFGYLSVEVAWEDRENIEIHDRGCYGGSNMEGSSMDLQKTEFVEENDKLDVYLKQNPEASLNHTCNSLKILLPSQIATLDVSKLPTNTNIDFENRASAIDTTIIAQNINNISGLYNHLRVWLVNDRSGDEHVNEMLENDDELVGDRFDDEPNLYQPSNFSINRATLDTLDLYSKNVLYLRFEEETDFNQANIYTLNDESSIYIDNLGLVERVHHHILNNEQLERLKN